MQFRRSNNRLFFIAGFGTKLGDNQGIAALAQEAEDRYAGRVNVSFHRWDDDWSDLAEETLRWSLDKQPRIGIVGHSWGCGFGALQLARELFERDMRVEHAWFADAVYHLGGRWCHKFGISQLSAYLPRPWHASGRPEIEIPDAFSRIDWWVQNNFRWLNHMTWLRGHELVWESKGAPVTGRHRTAGGTLHRWMDDAFEFKAGVRDGLELMFGEEAGHDPLNRESRPCGV